MQSFRVHKGKVAPLNRANVDTDQIIPKQFLKRIEKTGFGEFLFYDWRRSKNGSPDILSKDLERLLGALCECPQAVRDGLYNYPFVGLRSPPDALKLSAPWTTCPAVSVNRKWRP